MSINQRLCSEILIPNMVAKETPYDELKEVFIMEGDRGRAFRELFLCINVQLLKKSGWMDDFCCLRILDCIASPNWGYEFKFIPEGYRAIGIPRDMDAYTLLHSVLRTLNNFQLLGSGKKSQTWKVYTHMPHQGTEFVNSHSTEQKETIRQIYE